MVVVPFEDDEEKLAGHELLLTDELTGPDVDEATTTFAVVVAAVDDDVVGEAAA